MSHKSETFRPSYLKTSPRSNSEVAKHVTRKTNREVRQERKTGSWAPPTMAFAAPERPLGDVLAHRGATETVKTAPRAAETVAVDLNLTQLVALVSACLAAADHALVVAARWETLGDEGRSQQMYARSVMLESTAELLAKASRQNVTRE